MRPEGLYLLFQVKYWMLTTVTKIIVSIEGNMLGKGGNSTVRSSLAGIVVEIWKKLLLSHTIFQETQERRTIQSSAQGYEVSVWCV